MFFKLFVRQNLKRRYLLFGVLAATLIGCSGQNDAYYTIPNVELKGASCLGQVPNQINHFFNGKASQGETQAVWQCFHYALATFSDYVKGSNRELYTAGSLRHFLQLYFLKNAKRGDDGNVISDNLLNEIMQLKRLFLGGSAAGVTPEELNRALYVIDQLQGISVELLPYTSILFNSPAAGNMPALPPNEEVDAALKEFESATQQLTGLLSPNRPAYTFDHMQLLLKSVYNYFILQNPKAKIADYSVYIPLIAKAKALLLNSSTDQINPEEWSNIGQIAGQLYEMLIRKQYYLHADSLNSPPQLDEFQKLVFGVTGILKQAVQRRPNGAIPLSDVDGLLHEAIQLNMLPAVFDEPTTDTFVNRFFDTILNPQNVYPTSGISAPKIQYVEDQISSWVTVQDALISGTQLPREPAWVEMHDVLSGPWPMRIDNYGRVILDGRTDVPVNIESASRLNWARALAHVIFNAYIHDDNRRVNKKEMSKPELRQAYVDLKPVLVTFDLVNKDDDTFDQRLFRDANLFMPRSDGDDYLSFYELIEYVQYVFSGIDAGGVLINSADAACQLPNNLFDVDCFRRDMRLKLDLLLAHMPGFEKYSRGISLGDWQNNLHNIARTVRAKGDTQDPMTHTDVYESFILLQYIETLMLRFDTNHDGKIGITEALKMLKLFENTIKEALHPKPDDVEPLFTYILKYGELPDPFVDPTAQVRYEHWKLRYQQWKQLNKGNEDQSFLTIDRGRILKIIAYLSQLNI